MYSLKDVFFFKVKEMFFFFAFQLASYAYIMQGKVVPNLWSDFLLITCKTAWFIRFSVNLFVALLFYLFVCLFGLFTLPYSKVMFQIFVATWFFLLKWLFSNAFLQLRNTKQFPWHKYSQVPVKKSFNFTLPWHKFHQLIKMFRSFMLFVKLWSFFFRQDLFLFLKNLHTSFFNL